MNGRALNLKPTLLLFKQIIGSTMLYALLLTQSLRFCDGKLVVLARRIQKHICLNNIEPQVFQRIHLQYSQYIAYTQFHHPKMKVHRKRVNVSEFNYSIKKGPKTITKGYLHHRCIRIRILINYNYRSWNCISLSLTPILFSTTQKFNQM